MPANQLRADYTKPVIDKAVKEFVHGAGHVLRHFNRAQSKLVNDALKKKEGKIIKIRDHSYGGEAGRGYHLKLNSLTAGDHIEITVDNHYNYGVQLSPNETTNEISMQKAFDEFMMQATPAISRMVVDDYLQEASYAANFVAFDPANPGASLLKLKSKMKRRGMMDKPNMVRSTNMWEHIYNVQMSNTNNALISSVEKEFNILDDVNGLPTYKTGDRAGLCLKMYGACQSGCQIYIDGGSNAAGRLIIREGEVLEVCGVQAIDVKTHRPLGENMQFLVTRDVYADSTGKAEVTIEPELLPLNIKETYRNNLGQTASTQGNSNVLKAPKDGADVFVSKGLQPNTEYERTLVWYDDMMIKGNPPFSHPDMPNAKTVSSKPFYGRDKLTGGTAELAQFHFLDWYQETDLVYNMRVDLGLDFINVFPHLGFQLVGNALGQCDY